MKNFIYLAAALFFSISLQAAPSQQFEASPPKCPYALAKPAAASTPAPSWRLSPLTALRGTKVFLKNRFARRQTFEGYRAPTWVGTARYLALLAQNLQNPLRVLQYVHKHYGDYVAADVPTGHRFVFLREPELVEQVFKRTDVSGGTKGAFMKTELQSGGIARLVGYNAVFLAKGKQWRQERTVHQPEFTPKTINTSRMYTRLNQVIERHIDDLKQRVDTAGKPALSLALDKFITSLMMDIAIQCFFGYVAPLSELRESLAPAFAEVIRWVALETANPSTRSFAQMPIVTKSQAALREAYRTLNAFGNKVIAYRRQHPDPQAQDLLGTLLDYRDPSGQSLDDNLVKSEILTVLFAGHDATANVLTWAFQALLLDPQVQRKLTAEVDGLQNQIPDPPHLRTAMPYLHQVWNETLRLYSPAYAIAREATEDVVLESRRGRVFFPKGTLVVLSMIEMHRHPETWSRTGFDPEAFAPERWSAENLEAQGLKESDLTMFPFGSGPRVCLGIHFAPLEFKLAMTRLRQEFNFGPISDEKPQMISDTAVRIRGGLRAMVSRR